MKAAVLVLTVTMVACGFFGYQMLPRVREVKEASMLKLLYFELLEFGLRLQHFPQSLESAIQGGGLDDLPKGRIEYLESAMKDGWIGYVLSNEGGFTLTLITCRDRKIAMHGFSEQINGTAGRPAIDRF